MVEPRRNGERGRKITRRPTSLPRIAAFEKEFGKITKLLISGQEMLLEEFFLIPARVWAR